MPNLALMKLSAYHKKLNDTVEIIKISLHKNQTLLLSEDYQKIYLSSIFEENKEIVMDFIKRFKNIEIGGCFVAPGKDLPYEIEHIMPDYSIYNKYEELKCNYSMGFTTRGCIRNCPWCIVPSKEGKIHVNADIYEFWNPEHKHLELLDNNPMALPIHFKKIADQIIKENLSVSFHGLDVRLLNDENTEILSQLKIKPEPRFAFDTIKDEPWVLRGIDLMHKHGIKRALWYVLVGFNTTWEQDMYRINLLKKLKQRPYIMRFKTVSHDRKYADLASWVNQYQFFSSMTYERFIECRNDRRNINYKKYGNLNKWIKK